MCSLCLSWHHAWTCTECASPSLLRPPRPATVILPAAHSAPPAVSRAESAVPRADVVPDVLKAVSRILRSRMQCTLCVASPGRLAAPLTVSRSAPIPGTCLSDPRAGAAAPSARLCPPCVESSSQGAAACCARARRACAARAAAACPALDMRGAPVRQLTPSVATPPEMVAPASTSATCCKAWLRCCGGARKTASVRAQSVGACWPPVSSLAESLVSLCDVWRPAPTLSRLYGCTHCHLSLCRCHDCVLDCEPSSLLAARSCAGSRSSGGALYGSCRLLGTACASLSATLGVAPVSLVTASVVDCWLTCDARACVPLDATVAVVRRSMR